jgi:pimeloyl-ACP methyl ester carboxylesterase
MNEVVFFFGGYLASQSDIDKWLRTARWQKPAVRFIGFPWPSGAVSSDGDKAVEMLRKSGKLDSIIKDVEATKADKIFIVGHSSGCAIANAVDAGENSATHIVLVALDGYRPSDTQVDRGDTQVWGAKGAKGEKSLRFPGSAKGRRIFAATTQRTEWALHFSLVNHNVKADLSGSEIGKGYDDCQANLSFLGGAMEIR